MRYILKTCDTVSLKFSPCMQPYFSAEFSPISRKMSGILLSIAVLNRKIPTGCKTDILEQNVGNILQ